jgi:hypothetical protein
MRGNRKANPQNQGSKRNVGVTPFTGEDIVDLARVYVPIIVAFLLYQFGGGWIRQRRLRTRGLRDLVAELRQNIEHPKFSIYIDLEDEAYRRFRQDGLLFGLQTDLQPC